MWGWPASLPNLQETSGMVNQQSDDGTHEAQASHLRRTVSWHLQLQAKPYTTLQAYPT